MKNNKKVKEIVVLAVLMTVLVVAAVIQFSGASGSATPKASTQDKSSASQQAQTAPASANTVTVSPASGTAAASEKSDLGWVDGARLVSVVPEVSGGRDPFKDVDGLKDTVTVTQGAIATGKSPANASHEGGMLPGISHTSSFIPPSADKFGMIGAVNTQTPPFIPPPPPPPSFVLTGVVTTPSQRYAAITVDGHFFTLLEGETVPGYGWTVTQIQPSQVVLMKDSQSLSLRLSGGSSK
ncbi:MAG TPA: hypothetical protein VHV83_01070 [Armatimonadota bacterium]|nr:hypothetical protein [Armatimonadota bacterium]